MAYTKVFDKPYPVWHNVPTRDTPATAAVFEEYDAALEHIEDFLDGSTAVKPVSKTEAMTQQVGVDNTGKLFTTPGSGGGGSSSADEVTYDNTESGLDAENVQDAIDELAESGGGGSAASTTYDNTDSGFQADNVQDAIDEVSAKSLNPVSKTSAMTQAVGKDANGALWTTPGGGGGGGGGRTETVLCTPATSDTTYNLSDSISNYDEILLRGKIIQDTNTFFVENRYAVSNMIANIDHDCFYGMLSDTAYFWIRLSNQTTFIKYNSSGLVLSEIVGIKY